MDGKLNKHHVKLNLEYLKVFEMVQLTFSKGALQFKGSLYNFKVL